jgi:hypothetical protein
VQNRAAVVDDKVDHKAEGCPVHAHAGQVTPYVVHHGVSGHQVRSHQLVATLACATQPEDDQQQKAAHVVVRLHQLAAAATHWGTGSCIMHQYGHSQQLPATLHVWKSRTSQTNNI